MFFVLVLLLIYSIRFCANLKLFFLFILSVGVYNLCMMLCIFYIFVRSFICDFMRAIYLFNFLVCFFPPLLVAFGGLCYAFSFSLSLDHVASCCK